MSQLIVILLINYHQYQHYYFQLLLLLFQYTFSLLYHIVVFYYHQQKLRIYFIHWQHTYPILPHHDVSAWWLPSDSSSHQIQWYSHSWVLLTNIVKSLETLVLHLPVLTTLNSYQLDLLYRFNCLNHHLVMLLYVPNYLKHS